MNWIHIALAILLGGFVTLNTDWFFMGDWLYKRYDQHPEIWRHFRGQGETKAIAWAAPLPFLTCAAFTLLCVHLHLHAYNATLGLAFTVWLAVPVPLLIAHGLFIKLHPAIIASFSFGWLVKLVVAAIAVSLILR